MKSTLIKINVIVTQARWWTRKLQALTPPWKHQVNNGLTRIILVSSRNQSYAATK